MDIIKKRDVSFNLIANGEYELFIQHINEVLNTIYILKISIFISSDGNTFAKDTNNNDINKRLITTIAYSYPHIITETGEYVDGIMTLTFEDGSTFSNTDINYGAFWYSIDGYNNNIIMQYT